MLKELSSFRVGKNCKLWMRGLGNYWYDVGGPSPFEMSFLFLFASPPPFHPRPDAQAPFALLPPFIAAAGAKSLQLCPTLCDPIDVSPPGSPAPGILQARTLEWAAISFSNAWKWKVKVKSLSRVRLLVTLWTAAFQAPLFMGFSRQAYWSGVPLPFPPSLHYSTVIVLYVITHISGLLSLTCSSPLEFHSSF